MADLEDYWREYRKGNVIALSGGVQQARAAQTESVLYDIPIQYPLYFRGESWDKK